MEGESFMDSGDGFIKVSVRRLILADSRLFDMSR
jgi:hypothetical protein